MQQLREPIGVPFLRRVVATVTCAVLATLALAQSATTIGTIDATLNGESRSWHLLEFATDEGAQATASWNLIMDRIVDVSLQGHVEERFSTEGTLSISVTAFSLPEDCPCTFDTSSVMYFSSSSMFEDVYVSDDGGSSTVTFTTFEEVAEGVYRVEGTFSAEMPRVPAIGEAPDLSDVLAVEGAFVVERLARDPTGE